MSSVLLAAWMALAAIDSPLAQAAAALEQAARDAVVVTSVENMYAAPDPATPVVSQVLLGQLVGVVERRDGFALVETPDHYRGWVPEAAVFPYPIDAAPRYARVGPILEVTALMANLYRDPDVATARPKGQAPFGVRLEALPDAVLPPGTDVVRWLVVRLPSGETAYVQRGDVRRAVEGPRRAPAGADLVATARRFTGVPYLWGGMTARGLDCSGLMSRVYASYGVDLRRDADLQFADPRGQPVERDALQPGDLVFFGAKKVTHVGMYVGDGRFLSATTHETPMVHEDPLDDPRWGPIYRGARRMPPAAAR
jgi:cell wall-associated NlpC family hydrolase